MGSNNDFLFLIVSIAIFVLLGIFFMITTRFLHIKEFYKNIWKIIMVWSVHGHSLEDISSIDEFDKYFKGRKIVKDPAPSKFETTPGQQTQIGWKENMTFI